LNLFNDDKKLDDKSWLKIPYYVFEYVSLLK
jgi:hypothetical protein